MLAAISSAPFFDSIFASPPARVELAADSCRLVQNLLNGDRRNKGNPMGMT
jgi:hypothetical protein